MEFNKLIFPAPQASYDFTHPNLIFIPKKQLKKNLGFIDKLFPTNTNLEETKSPLESKKINREKMKTPNSPQLVKNLKKYEFIPCLFFPYYEKLENKGSNTILIYFHGNAEDLGIAQDLLLNIQNELQIHILAVEYPGYGLYNGDSKAEKILSDSEIVYDYLVNELNFPEKNIIIFGRSIGTGPATHLAARRSPAALILMSAYISIKAVVVHLIGRFLAALVADRFKNIDEIQKVKVPTFFLHGKKDDLIPCYHSKELYNKSHIGEYWFPNDMTHNSFNIIKDLLIPIDNFLEKYKYQIKNETIYKGFKFLNINDIANLHELEKLNNEGNVTNSIFKGKK